MSELHSQLIEFLNTNASALKWTITETARGISISIYYEDSANPSRLTHITKIVSSHAAE